MVGHRIEGTIALHCTMMHNTSPPSTLLYHALVSSTLLYSTMCHYTTLFCSIVAHEIDMNSCRSRPGLLGPTQAVMFNCIQLGVVPRVRVGLMGKAPPHALRGTALAGGCACAAGHLLDCGIDESHKFMPLRKGIHNHTHQFIRGPVSEWPLFLVPLTDFPRALPAGQTHRDSPGAAGAPRGERGFSHTGGETIAIAPQMDCFLTPLTQKVSFFSLRFERAWPRGGALAHSGSVEPQRHAGRSW